MLKFAFESTFQNTTPISPLGLGLGDFSKCSEYLWPLGSSSPPWCNFPVARSSQCYSLSIFKWKKWWEWFCLRRAGRGRRSVVSTTRVGLLCWLAGDTRGLQRPKKGIYQSIRSYEALDIIKCHRKIIIRSSPHEIDLTGPSHKKHFQKIKKKSYCIPKWNMSKSHTVA